MKSVPTGSTWIDTISGPLVSYVTLLSPEVESTFRFPATSSTLSARIDGTTVPSTPTFTASTAKIVLSLTWATSKVTNCAVPLSVTSSFVKVAGSIGSENVAVNSTGATFVGSACPTACSIVTVGRTVSTS